MCVDTEKRKAVDNDEKERKKVCGISNHTILETEEIGKKDTGKNNNNSIFVLPSLNDHFSIKLVKPTPAHSLDVTTKRGSYCHHDQQLGFKVAP